MTLKFNGQHVFRTGQRLVLETKPKTKKEDNVKVNLSQQDQGRWSRLITLIETFFSEQLAISGKPDFQLQQPPQTELTPLSEQEKTFLNALFNITVGYFQTGVDISAVEGFHASTSPSVEVIIIPLADTPHRRMSQPSPSSKHSRSPVETSNTRTL